MALAMVLEILGQVYGRHATSAKRALDLVAVGEGGGEPGGDLGHGTKMGRVVGFGEVSCTPCVPNPDHPDYWLGEAFQLLTVGFLIHQCPQVFLGQVRVSHRRRQIRVAHRFLDVYRILLLGQPRCHPSVPQIVLIEIERELGPSCG